MKITNLEGALGAMERVGYAVGVGLLVLGTAGTAHAHQASALHPVPAQSAAPGAGGGGGLPARLLAFGDPDDGGQFHHN
jgi:hypothetical protein